MMVCPILGLGLVMPAISKLVGLVPGLVSAEDQFEDCWLMMAGWILLVCWFSEPEWLIPRLAPVGAALAVES